MKQLDLLLHAQTAPDETAAIILGEGGYVPAPPEFIRRLRRAPSGEHIFQQHQILQKAMLFCEKNQGSFPARIATRLNSPQLSLF